MTDSGTTLFYFMDAFGEKIAQEAKETAKLEEELKDLENKEVELKEKNITKENEDELKHKIENTKEQIKSRKWYKKVCIYTNNIPGALKFMVNTRADKEELPIECHLFSGEILPRYSFLTGGETIQSLWDLKKKVRNHDDSMIISLITGNWVVAVKDEEAGNIIIPLAKGGKNINDNENEKGRLAYKKVALECCDEAYLICSLGKIINFLGEGPLNYKEYQKRANELISGKGFNPIDSYKTINFVDKVISR